MVLSKLQKLRTYISYILGLASRPRLNFQLVGGPKMYVEEVNPQGQEQEMQVVEARFKRSE